jgi:hypothetical protein
VLLEAGISCGTVHTVGTRGGAGDGGWTFMGAHTHTMRLLTVAALAGAGLVVVLALSSGMLNAGTVLLGLALVVAGVALLVAQRRQAAEAPGSAEAPYTGRHRQA